jgi:hypothetical protein
MHILLVRVWLAVAMQQVFGNLMVDWSKQSEPSVLGAKPLSHAQALERKFIHELEEIANGLGARCSQCSTQRHWVSAIRHFVLAAEESELQNLLRERALWCEECRDVEQWRSRAMSVVQLPSIDAVGAIRRRR